MIRLYFGEFVMRGRRQRNGSLLSLNLFKLISGGALHSKRTWSQSRAPLLRVILILCV
jgi:hypothetical protein